MAPVAGGGGHRHGWSAEGIRLAVGSRTPDVGRRLLGVRDTILSMCSTRRAVCGGCSVGGSRGIPSPPPGFT